MDEATKRKFNANIKAVNGDLIEIVEERLPTDELIKLKLRYQNINRWLWKTCTKRKWREKSNRSTNCRASGKIEEFII